MYSRAWMRIVLFTLALPACDTMSPSEPGNLVPRTVVEDASLPAIEMNGARFHAQTLGNPAFAGAAAFFGHGVPDPHGRQPPAMAAAEHGGHGDVPRPPLQPGVKERFDLELNITRALRAQKADAPGVSLKLVAVDVAGNEVPAEKLILEEIVLEFE